MLSLEVIRRLNCRGTCHSYIVLQRVCVCVCVFFPLILDVRLVDVPAGVAQEESHTGFLIHLPSAVVVVVFFTLTDRASTIPNNTRGCQSGTWSAGQKLLASIFLERRIQPFLSLVDHEVEFCVLTI